MPNYYDQRTSTLKTIYDRIESACRKHRGIAQFDCGDLDTFGDNYKYPLVYLETINHFEENERKNGETFSIALNIIDRSDENELDRESMIASHDRLKQLFTELKMYLSQDRKPYAFGRGSVSPASVLVFNRFEPAALYRLRGEFTVTVDMVMTDTADLDIIFEA